MRGTQAEQAAGNHKREQWKTDRGAEQLIGLDRSPGHVSSDDGGSSAQCSTLQCHLVAGYVAVLLTYALVHMLCVRNPRTVGLVLVESPGPKRSLSFFFFQDVFERQICKDM